MLQDESIRPKITADMDMLTHERYAVLVVSCQKDCANMEQPVEHNSYMAH